MSDNLKLDKLYNAFIIFNNGFTVFCVLMALILVSPGLILAAPSVTGVSGSITQNSQISISGSGFGVKSPAAPLVWDTFENGTSGQKINQSNAIVGRWDSGAGSDQPKYSAGAAWAGSKSAELNFTKSVYNASLSKNRASTTQFETIYIDYRMRLNLIDNNSRNFKPWRLYGDASGELPQFCHTIIGGGSSQLHHFGSNCGTSPYVGTAPKNNQWMHYQIGGKSSTGTKADGHVFMYQNGGGARYNNTSAVTRCSTSQNWSQIRIGHYWATDSVDGYPANSGATVFVDNVYIDNTWARVELGNASTYANSGHREIQIPTAWSSSGITVTANTGAFTANQPVYLYVTDANGNVNSQGYPITIGSVGSAPPPPTSSVAVPEKLRVVE